MKTIVFFNHFHNGDVFLSKEFVRYFTVVRPDWKFIYSHGNPSNLILDVEDVEYRPAIYFALPYLSGITEENGVTFVNTWVGAMNHAFLGKGCTIQAVYDMFTHYTKELLGEGLPPIEDFVPRVDYSQYKIHKAREFFKSIHPDPDIVAEIFISNGDVQSQQADNFNMNNLISDLADQHNDCRFFLSNIMGDRIQKENILYTQDIIGSEGKSDLNENGFASLHCDIIIGRSSGSFTFSLTKRHFDFKKTYYTLLSGSGFNGFDQLPSACKFISINDIQDLRPQLRKDIDVLRSV
jgi:hypothetical protein